MSSRIAILASLLSVVALGAAWADEPAPVGARTAVIPAHQVWVEKDVAVPPVTEERRVPRYETVMVPVYEDQRVPVMREVDVPTYETVEVPTFKTERVPVWGHVDVPVYVKEKKPVGFSLWNPFACKCERIDLWDRCVDVQVGTEQQPAVVDHVEREVASGTRLERVQTGVTKTSVVAGHRTERVLVGERETRRLAGYDTQLVVIEPARVDKVRECVDVPEQIVTVVSDGAAGVVPLPGTSEVLTEEAYQARLAAVR